VIDVNCFVGNWPFRRIPYRTVADINGLMARMNVRSALVTPLAGLFYKDCLSAVREMLDELQACASVNMHPVAVVNPAFPGWQDDLATMLDDWGCVAIRLFPNYHGYQLTDSAAEALLDTAQKRQTPVIISVRIEDERLQHWLCRVPPVSHLDLQWVLRAFPKLRLALYDVNPNEVQHLGDDIRNHLWASIDTSGRLPQFYMEDMIQQLGSEHIMYGSGMPLKYPECTMQQVMRAAVSEQDKNKILSANAVRLFDPVLGKAES
jgi:uncharacterized protein